MVAFLYLHRPFYIDFYKYYVKRNPMSDHAEQISFVDVHFDVMLKERIIRFIKQFAPTYKGYLLDQTPNQLYSKEFIIRIYYDEYSTFTITCYSAEMMQQRIQNILNINKQ